MNSPVLSALRAATRRPGEPLNVLCAPTHERWETGLARTAHRFWGIQGGDIKSWNPTYGPLPTNYTVLDGSRGDRQVPADVEFDLVLSQNKASQYPPLSRLAKLMHLPIVNLEHCLPPPGYSPDLLRHIKQQHPADLHVFITDYSRERWMYGPEEAAVVYHGIDTDLFAPDDRVERRPVVLSVVNDWKNRDWCCGYNYWVEATRDLPVRPVGATPGLSEPARDLAALVREYQSAAVFVNTSLVSPVPTALMEAMACGCCVVSTRTCAIPEFVEDGQNGLLADSPAHMRTLLVRVLNDPGLRRRLGDAARRTILDRYPLGRYVAAWDRLFRLVADR